MKDSERAKQPGTERERAELDALNMRRALHFDMHVGKYDEEKECYPGMDPDVARKIVFSREFENRAE